MIQSLTCDYEMSLIFTHRWNALVICCKWRTGSSRSCTMYFTKQVQTNQYNQYIWCKLTVVDSSTCGKRSLQVSRLQIRWCNIRSTIWSNMVEISTLQRPWNNHSENGNHIWEHEFIYIGLKIIVHITIPVDEGGSKFIDDIFGDRFSEFLLRIKRLIPVKSRTI